MKKILLSIVLSALFVACGKESDSLPNKESENLPDLTAIIVKEYPCDTLNYIGRIGNDFDSALDSFKILYKQTLEFYGEDGYNIKKEKIIVDFNYDDRAFSLLTFIDKKNINNWLITGIVIDEKGNYFYVNED